MAADSSTSRNWGHHCAQVNWTPLALDNPLWRYACSVYQHPQVQECCLRLQNTQGADVNALLSAGWCAALGAYLPTNWLATLTPSGLIDTWRRQVIIPCRRLRTDFLTETNQTQRPLRTTKTPSDTRKRILQVEIFCEQMELSLLFLGLRQALQEKKIVTINSSKLSKNAFCYQNLIACFDDGGQSQANLKEHVSELAAAMTATKVHAPES